MDEYIGVIEFEDRCEHFTAPDFMTAVFWVRFYMYSPGVWSVWVTDFTWGSVLYDDGVCVGL